MPKPVDADTQALLADGPALGFAPSEFLTRSSRTQRGRLLVAGALVIAERGYAGATVSDIVAAAGVSRTAFYQHFEGKEECLIEAYRASVTITLQRMAEAATEAAAHGWRAALAAGVRSVFDTIRDHPAIARATYVELAGAGSAGLAARREGNERFAAQIKGLADAVREIDPAMPTADARLIRLVISGLELQVAYAINDGELDALDALAEVALAALAAVFAARD
jgi:AcrR family transcriptional regulator